jgi:hypothetical protein
MANEGMGDSISDVLPTMDYLLHHIEAAKKATTLPHLATMMETAWAKLADYYELTEDSPVYSAATVLHPSLKWAYMEKTWEDRNEWIEKAKARVGELWREIYKSTTSSCPVFRPSSAQGPSTGRPNGYKVWMKEQKATIFNMDDDEYEVYCREPVLMVSDPLKWWLEPAQRRRFPNLSMMAIDILSIAPMSTETERLFSKAKLTVTDQRGSMNIETLNLLECLRSWDRSTLIVPSEVSIPLREVFDCLIMGSSIAMSIRQPRLLSPMPMIQNVRRRVAEETFRRCHWRAWTSHTREDN